MKIKKKKYIYIYTVYIYIYMIDCFKGILMTQDFDIFVSGEKVGNKWVKILSEERESYKF